MYNDEDDLSLMEPPKHDMLHVKFRGDNHVIVLPYCEVANGYITDVADEKVSITIHKEEPPTVEKVDMKFVDFTKLVETTFDIKEVTSLTVQLAGKYDVYTIL
jgi:hypothetical protein